MSVDFIKGEAQGEELDINDYLVKYPLTTFFMKAEVAGPDGSDIKVGDVLAIDRSRNPVTDDLVVATKDEELIIASWNNKTSDLVLWGVIIGLVRKF